MVFQAEPVVVGEHDQAFERGAVRRDRQFIEPACQLRPRALDDPWEIDGVLRQQLLAGGERLLAGVEGANGRADRAGGIGHGQVQVAPVDAHVVPAAFEHWLRRRAAELHVEPGDFQTAPVHRLPLVVDHQLRGGVEIKRCRVGFAVLGNEAEFHERHRLGENRQFLRQQRGQEGDGQFHAPCLETANRARGMHLAGGLRHRGQGSRRRPQEAERLPVDARQTRKRVAGARLMLGPVVGEVVAERPHAEVRIDHGQRHGRRAERGKSGRTRLHGVAIRLANSRSTVLSGVKTPWTCTF